MKRCTFLLFITCISIFLCNSCNVNKSVKVEPDYSTFNPAISNKTTLITDVPHSKPIDKEAIMYNNVKEDTSNNNDTEKEWPYELTFKGIASSKKTQTGNLNSNFKINLTESFLICPDNNNDVIYYINYNKDNYIYQIKNGISTLLVEKKAKYLQLWNNELYFLSNNNKYDNVFTGDIYCYNIMTKDLQLILKGDAQTLYIDSYGIFYHKLFNIESKGIIGCHLDFKSTIVQEVDYIYPISFNEYQIITTKDGIFLNNREKQQKVSLAPLQYIANNISLYDHYFTFSSKSRVYILDLETGDQKIYDMNDYKELDNEVIIIDYIIINDTIYAISGGPSIYKYNMTTGVIEVFEYITENFRAGIGINSLFTDSNNIFAIMQTSGNDRLVEVFLTKNDEDRNVITIKELGE